MKLDKKKYIKPEIKKKKLAVNFFYSNGRYADSADGLIEGSMLLAASCLACGSGSSSGPGRVM